MVLALSPPLECAASSEWIKWLARVHDLTSSRVVGGMIGSVESTLESSEEKRPSTICKNLKIGGDLEISY
jgi:hypothetical protein